MCGIFGYVGEQVDVIPLVSRALRTMEYRGYDSWGIGWKNEALTMSLTKAPGRVPGDVRQSATSTLALGHTRWATHGGVTEANAHPHIDGSTRIGVVHNGVIENADTLRSTFIDPTTFRSETDTEVVAHLVERELRAGAPFSRAVLNVFGMLEGSNAIVVANAEQDELAAITSRSPLHLGRGGQGWFLASDPLALTGHCVDMAVIPDFSLLTITDEGASLKSTAEGLALPFTWVDVPCEQDVQRGAFDHFTIKEIHDQVGVLRDLHSRAHDVATLADLIKRHDHVLFTGCGSALYAAMLGAEWLKAVTDTWIDVLPASEIEATTRNHGPRTLVVALTQSGETADVIDALHVARCWGSTLAAIINVETSTVSRTVDCVVPIRAGVERSVLATKSFLAMVCRMKQLAEMLDVGGPADDGIDMAIDQIERLLASPDIPRLADYIARQEHVLVLGKGVAHKVALESALKIKEGSYIHAEAYLAGELKHGPLALVTRGTPTILFATSDIEQQSARIAGTEVASRGGVTIGIGRFNEVDCQAVLPVRDLGRFTPMAALVAAQRLAYLVAVNRGVDPDFPRNLAKSVTVR